MIKTANPSTAEPNILQQQEIRKQDAKQEEL